MHQISLVNLELVSIQLCKFCHQYIKSIETDSDEIFLILLFSMVAEKVEVLTKSAKANSVGLRWISDGTGTFEIEEIDDIPIGTQIILHLKSECREYADEERVKSM